jgi:hypothetical protein
VKETIVMKRIMFALAAAAIAASTSAALAASGPYEMKGPYRWCAKYNNMTGDCGFSFYQQCREALAGNGGQCMVNPGWIAKHPDRFEMAPPF